MYYFTMSSNPFLSKEVKFKRVLKGLAIISPVLIMIFVIGNYYFNLIDGTLREHYTENKVLGVEDTAPKLIGSYGDVDENDTFVWDWDSNWNRDGYYHLSRFVDSPQYFLTGGKVTLKESWDLRNGYKLNMSCEELDMSEAIAGDSYSCALSYNGKTFVKDVRYEAYCDDFKNHTDCHGSVNLVVFSDIYADQNTPEYVIVSTWASGTKDWVSVYKLESGVATLLPFSYDSKLEDHYYMSESSFDMYFSDSDGNYLQGPKDPLEFVTYFHEPSMGSQLEDTRNNVEGIYKIWDIAGDKLILKETVVDLYREGDTAHWL